MTTHPSLASVATEEDQELRVIHERELAAHAARKRAAQHHYVADIFMHAADQDSRVIEARRAVDAFTPSSADGHALPMTFTAREANRLADAVTEHESALCRLHAELALVSVERAKLIATAAPEYQQGIFDLSEPDELNGFLRPIFEEAGIGERFVPAVRRDD